MNLKGLTFQQIVKCYVLDLKLEYVDWLKESNACYFAQSFKLSRR